LTTQLFTVILSTGAGAVLRCSGSRITAGERVSMLDLLCYSAVDALLVRLQPCFPGT
jgi:hypothetical protein